MCLAALCFSQGLGKTFLPFSGSSSDSLSFSRSNNFTALRYLDIAEDPTFIPVVAAEGKIGPSKSEDNAEILQKLMDTGQVVDVDWKKSLAGAGDCKPGEQTTANNQGK